MNLKTEIGDADPLSASPRLAQCLALKYGWAPLDITAHFSFCAISSRLPHHFSGSLRPLPLLMNRHVNLGNDEERRGL